MSLILMTTLFYKAVILQGEIWRWSLLGLKGLSSLFQLKSNETEHVYCSTVLSQTEMHDSLQGITVLINTNTE